MTREIILRTSATTGVLALLLLPLAAQSSRLQLPEPKSIASVLHAAVLSPATAAPAIQIPRDPFVPLANAAKQQTDGNVIVRAIALGNQSAALVDENGKTRLLATGDTIAGSRVNAITARDIILTDGRHLVLPVSQ